MSFAEADRRARTPAQMNGMFKPRNRGNGTAMLALIVSVLLNLAMTAAWAWGLRHAEGERVAAPSESPATPVGPFWRERRPPSRVEADLSRFAGIWARFEAPDYVRLMQNLRAAGCPEAAIRNIVRPRIDDDFDQRKGRDLPKPEYWRTASQFATLKRSILPRLSAIEIEKHQTISGFWPGEGCRSSEAFWDETNRR